MVKKSDFNRKSLIIVGLNIVLAVVLLVVVLSKIIVTYFQEDVKSKN